MLNSILGKLKNNENLLNISLLASVLIYGFILLIGKPSFVDERHHLSQINMFLSGDFTQLPSLTTIPGYHALISALGYITSINDLSNLRILSFLIIILFYYFFYLFIKEDRNYLSVFPLIIASPIALSYNFMLYTDILSLMLVLSGFYLTIRKKYFISAFVFTLAFLTKQTNIVWAVMSALYIYTDHYSFKITQQSIYSYIKKVYPFIFLGLGFLGFIHINGSIALGDKNSHQAGFYIENLYVFLFTSLVLLLPLLVTKSKEILKFIIDNKYLYLVTTLINVVILFTFYNPTHPYNNGDFFIHNFVTNMFTSGFGLVSLSLASTLALFIIAFIKPLKSKFLIIYPFILIFLVPIELVDTRYYIIPLSLILLVSNIDKKDKLYILAYYVAIAIPLIWLLSDNRLFL